MSSVLNTIIPTAQIKAGDKLPSADNLLEENAPGSFVGLPTTGRIVVVGTPGAFSSTCSNEHLPAYIADYRKFTSAGITGIYVISVNDAFVMNAWKEQLGKDSQVHFLADAAGKYTTSLGLTFDARGLLGTYRAKRFALVVDNGVVKSVEVEPDPSKVTVTSAAKTLAAL